MTVTLGTLPLVGTDADGVRWSTQGPTSNWWDGPASTAAAVQKPRSHGGWSGDAYNQAAHVTVPVLLSAPTSGALDGALDRLKTAASLSITTLTWDDGRYVLVKREDAVLVKRHSPTVALASVQLLAPDPRRFGQSLVGSAHLPSSSGGLTIPYTIPYTISATTVSGQVSLTNPGNVAGPVQLRIDGPVTGPVVTHVSSGRALVFAASLVLGAGQWVEVDMEARTVLENGQSSRNGWVTSRGWSSFEPGDNTWAFTAVGYDAGSLLTVTATEAWE